MSEIRYAKESLGSLSSTAAQKEQPRDLSEVESELGNLNNIIDDSFKLIYELKERLVKITKSPRPENPVGINGRVSPDSNIGCSIREQSYKVEQINNEISDLIARLAV